MSEPSELRLLLVGDDDALDALSELARHLPVFELQRLDALPERALGEDDVLVIGAGEPRVRDAILREAMSRGRPRHVTLLDPPGGEAARGAGARAILAAAELVRALLPSVEA